MAKFIIVNSKDSADMLIKSGFVLVNQTGDHWFFLNDNKLTFSEGVKVVYTNILAI